MATLGVFMSLDLLLFFLFYEISLVPMFFMINQWGGANRRYASLKFMLYTMASAWACCWRSRSSVWPRRASI